MKITICGSIGFYPEMESVRDELARCGHEVKIPELSLEAPGEYGGGRKVYFGSYIEENGGIDAFPSGHGIWGLKEKAIRDHYGKISWCDAILVVNHEKRGLAGYIGGNTLIEIGVAFYLNKKIFILNPVSSELSYKQEIMGMQPIMLNGNLSHLSATETPPLKMAIPSPAISMNSGGGLIKTVVVIAVIVLVLGYFGFDIEAIVNSPIVQKNIQYVWGIALYLWHTFFEVPFRFMWDTIIVGVFWNLIEKLLAQLPR